MKIIKINENPFRKWEVKRLPKDAIYIQHNVNNNEVYYSKIKNCYYEIIK